MGMVDATEFHKGEDHCDYPGLSFNWLFEAPGKGPNSQPGTWNTPGPNSNWEGKRKCGTSRLQVSYVTTVTTIAPTAENLCHAGLYMWHLI